MEGFGDGDLEGDVDTPGDGDGRAWFDTKVEGWVRTADRRGAADLRARGADEATVGIVVGIPVLEAAAGACGPTGRTD